MRNFDVDVNLPDFSFSVGAKKYPLRYDFGAFRAYQKLTGDFPFRAGFVISSENLSEMLWAGAVGTHSDLTIEMVGQWLTPTNMQGFYDLVVDAYVASFPEKQPKETVPDPPSA